MDDVKFINKSSLLEMDSHRNENLDVWNECPGDILINIFSFLDLEDLDSIRAVNKKWNILSYDKRVFSRKDMRDIIVTGSIDNTLKVWREEDPSSLNSWKEIKILKGHKDTVIFSCLQYFKFNFIFRLVVVVFQEMENILFLVHLIKLF